MGARPGEDSWRERDGHKSCSYCGSITPDEVFAAIETGNQVTPTDKSYKIYVDVVDPNEGKPRIVGSANFNPGGEGWVLLTAENRDTLPLDDWAREHWKNGEHWVRIEPRGKTVHAKFYFQHFSADEQQRFIDLLNAKKLNLAYPGHFYVSPFFARRGAA